MKKRICAFLLAALIVLPCLPLTVSAAEEPEETAAAASPAESAAYEADDFARYGDGEEYAIVPCNAGGSRVDDGGSQIHIWRAHHKDNQIWTLVKVGDYYCIKSKATGKVVGVPQAKAELRKELQCYQYNGGDNQLWRLEDMGDGTYAIHSKLNDSLVWNVKGYVWDNGAAIQLYSMNGQANERFRFIHTSTVEPMSEWGSSRRDCAGSNWSVWDGSCNYDWYYDHQNERDLYINTAADLFGLASFVVNGVEMPGKTIHLTSDINLAGITWTPIGWGDHWFRGSFNGHGHTITGLTRVDTSEGSDNSGLFGLVQGGTICNLAVKGSIAGDERTGGVVGYLQYGHLCNVYSEVTLSNCTDVKEGGIVGEIGPGGLVDHCTQNASVTSTDYDSYRGGIAGYSEGTIRYSVNNADVSHNWDGVGGIAGGGGSSIIEFCANHGTISGGSRTEFNGGIVGDMNDGIILGCYNDGSVFTSGNNYVGGIVGRKGSDWNVICCINDGRVYGNNNIGGICGEGRPIKCLNLGVVTGNGAVGAISGNAKLDTPWCYALAYSAANLSGKAGSRAAWVTATEIMSGRICFELNYDSVTNTYYGITAPLTQNIGSDPVPTFGSAEVNKNGDAYANGEYRVTAEYERGYGSVEGAGVYQAGDNATLTAIPAAGCVFDHFEVKTSDDTHDWTGFNGEKYYYPTVTVETYKEETITLTMDKSYTVRAVFTVFDDVPADMKVSVKLELECTNDVGGWNNDAIPVTLVDSAGGEHRWSTNQSSLNAVGAKVSHTFDLGTASPVAVEVAPDFGGGLTFRDYGLKARIWVNGNGEAMESGEVIIRSWPFVSSVSGGDYMSISFENFGNSEVDNVTFSKCSNAWEKARSITGSNVVLQSAWLLESPLELSAGQSVTLDLNGYPVIRTVKKAQNDGELFYVGYGATLTIKDSAPTRQSCDLFSGGSIQGGRSDNTAGLIECRGTLIMEGGTLFNGGTTDKGGAIKLSGSGMADLKNVLIANCWTDKAVFAQNEGGAIYMKDQAQATLKNCTVRQCRALDYGGGVYLEDKENKLICENVDIIGCTADGNQGGGAFQNEGEITWIGGSVVRCRAGEDHGGGFYLDGGKASFQNVRFEENYAEDNGGAIYADGGEGLWLFGCSFLHNRADDDGGAIYVNNGYMSGGDVYMEDCTVSPNSAGGEGGGVYLASSCTIGVAGITVIRGNDGEDTMDNLVMGRNTEIYDHGLNPGSEIHLRSDSDGTVKLGGSLMSEYQLKEYFFADYGTLELAETTKINTELRASVFSGGVTALIIGGALAVIVPAGWIFLRGKKRKGETK